MSSVAISPKWDNYPWIDKSKTNGSLKFTTKGQRTASRKNNKLKYIQMRAYTVPTKARWPHLDCLCTNQGPKEKALRTYQDPK
jgi:hypothetical protein